MSKAMLERESDFRETSTGAFAFYEDVPEQKMWRLEQKLFRRLLGAAEPPLLGANTWREIECREVRFDSMNGGDEDFDPVLLCKETGICPQPEVYVDFLDSGGDRISLQELASYWQHIYHPMDDLLFFDDSLSWLVHVWHHDGNIGVVLPPDVI